MKKPKYNIRLLYIDLFCGAGGTSTGVESARIRGSKCAKVVACVNHDPNAIASHSANHRQTMHFTEDIRTLDLTEMVHAIANAKTMYPDAKVVLWASLECTNFSKAKGGQPRDADSRTLAEHLFRYIEAINPDYIQIENVVEFMSWGDVDEKGHPIDMKKGTSYIRWVRNVCDYGYHYDYRNAEGQRTESNYGISFRLSPCRHSGRAEEIHRKRSRSKHVQGAMRSTRNIEQTTIKPTTYGQIHNSDRPGHREKRHRNTRK